MSSSEYVEGGREGGGGGRSGVDNSRKFLIFRLWFSEEEVLGLRKSLMSGTVLYSTSASQHSYAPIIINLDSVRISPLSRWKVRTGLFSVGGWSGVLLCYQQFFQSRRSLGGE